MRWFSEHFLFTQGLVRGLLNRLYWVLVRLYCSDQSQDISSERWVYNGYNGYNGG
jgi:hypothetical protein